MKQLIWSLFPFPMCQLIYLIAQHKFISSINFLFLLHTLKQVNNLIIKVTQPPFRFKSSDILVDSISFLKKNEILTTGLYTATLIWKKNLLKLNVSQSLRIWSFIQLYCLGWFFSSSELSISVYIYIHCKMTFFWLSSKKSWVLWKI